MFLGTVMSAVRDSAIVEAPRSSFHGLTGLKSKPFEKRRRVAVVGAGILADMGTEFCMESLQQRLQLLPVRGLETPPFGT